MSKTTKRDGKPLYTLFLRTEAEPLPTERLKRQWAELDRCAKAEYNKPYDSLKRAEAIQLHVNIKEGKYRELAKTGTNQRQSQPAPPVVVA